jgi:YceI-like protein
MSSAWVVPEKWSARRAVGALVAVVALLAPGIRADRASAGPRAIDRERSSLTISVYKSGFFSAFADNHTIRGRVAEGAVSDTEPLSAVMTVRARDLEVLDPALAADKRAEVQARMLSAEVLDAERYPTITFASKRVEPTAAGRWRVEGELTLHGTARSISFEVALSGTTYRGSVRIRQHDFGITPISIAGGTVKVKDEVLIEFAIVAASA